MIDLIDETGQDLSCYGYETQELSKFGATCNRLAVDSKEKSKQLGFDMGHYFILNAPLLSLMMEEHEEMLKKEISSRLTFLFKENKIKKKSRILLVGIGNPEIVADCFGVSTVEKVTILPYKKNNRLFKLVPNTFANTGFNSYDIIRLIVEAFDISAVILFDSLATTNVKRLGCSIQFNDAGLTPGSAMNNFGKAINKDTLNVPCIAIGVPMMISSKDLARGLKNEIIFTEKDVKEKIKFLSSIVAEIIDELVL